jgi:hypothetical protein
MRGGDVDALRVAFVRPLEAFRPHRTGDELEPIGTEDLARALITGILDEDGIAGLEEHSRGKAQALLRAAHHDEFLGRRSNRAIAEEVVSDRLPSSGSPSGGP